MRLGIRFDIEQEARFLSHHDMMRLMTRAAARAGLPLRFTEGFNPRPKAMLPLPRPVGVAACNELLVVELTQAVEPAEMAGRLTAQLPEGITVTECLALAGRKAPLAKWAEFALPVDEARQEPLQQRLTALDAEHTWPCQRKTTKPGKPGRMLDLRQLAGDLRLDGCELKLRLIPHGQVWARVEELLALLGLDVHTDRAAIRRTHVRWAGLESPTPTPSPQE